MRIVKHNNFYTMDSYYRTEINMSTSRDATHLVSVFKSFCPDLDIDVVENDKETNAIKLNNVRNHMGQRIKITYSKYL